MKIEEKFILLFTEKIFLINSSARLVDPILAGIQGKVKIIIWSEKLVNCSGDQNINSNYY